MKEYKAHIISIVIFGILPIIYFKNILFLVVLASYLFFAYLTWRRIRKPVFQLIVFYIVHCIILQLLFNKFFAANANETFKFFMSFLASIMVLILPFFLLLKSNNILFNIVTPKEKQYAKLICKEHLTRTQPLFMEDGGISIVCRIDDNCAKDKKLKYANRLIGVIGESVRKPTKNQDYYVNLWNHYENKIRYGDYDFIEIYQSDTIKDYNNVLSQIMSFFYNDLNGYKSMNEIVVKIFGQLNLSENTKRLLKKNFKIVEYYKLP